jgi:hypothetical protein
MDLWNLCLFVFSTGCLEVSYIHILKTQNLIRNYIRALTTVFYVRIPLIFFSPGATQPIVGVYFTASIGL